MIQLDPTLTPASLLPAVTRAGALAADKARLLRRRWNPADGTPVFTAAGQYTARGWTEWTQGFQYGFALQAFELTGESDLWETARADTRDRMASHVTHTGVHDHGFNNVSTYGHLLRLGVEGRTKLSPWERSYYELALKASGAVQASRWTTLPEGRGYIPSFNGAHSLFADTVRSLRSLAVAYRLGHVLQGEQDERINLLGRLVRHAEATAKWNVYFGTGRDTWDERGRVAHESLFNVESGSYRCPSTQQGYSPFSTWTRGQAWILLGFAEQLEFLTTVPTNEFEALGFAPLPDKASVLARFLETARAVADHYLAHTPTDGVPYWDTGAPGLVRLGAWSERASEVFNDFEPVDSSAAAIAAQGLLRLGAYLGTDGAAYTQAGLVVARTLFSDRFLSLEPLHEGFLLHAVYHRPNGWDFVPPKRQVPCGESCLWGDYHAAELAVWLNRAARGDPMPTFFAVKESL